MQQGDVSGGGGGADWPELQETSTEPRSQHSPVPDPWFVLLTMAGTITAVIAFDRRRKTVVLR